MSAPDQMKPTPADKLWTPANIVTLVRICLVPLFVVALLSPWPLWFGLPQVADDSKTLIAAGIFILISCTDWLDGYLARRRDEVTDFGKFMDPLADKILVASALLALIELGALPSWVVLVILAREFIVSGVRMVAASEGAVIAASWYGKAKTVSQMIAIVLFTIKDSYMVGTVHAAFSDWIWMLSWTVMIVALVLTIVSMLDYIAKARHLIGLGSKKHKGSTQSAPGIDSVAIDPKTLEKLASSVLDAARTSGKTLATAESLTGGLIAAELTRVPGSSEVVRGAVVSYTNEVKCEALGVDADTLGAHGAVSEQTARAMATGARARLGSSMAIAVTGVAGPTGGSTDTPVGSVWLARADETGVVARKQHFTGARDQVRAQTVHAALQLMKEGLDPR